MNTKIVTLTLSPCIDRSTTVPDLIPEKKLRCSEPVLNPGGGGINVSRLVKRLGGEGLAIYPAGGATGALFNELLAQEAVPSVVIPSRSETRENFIVLEESTGKQFRFGMPGTPLDDKEWNSCLEAVNKAEEVNFIVASGSLPPGVPFDIYAKVAAIARQKNARFIVDTSGEALKHAIGEGVFLVKPNLNELGALSGMPVAGSAQIIEAAKHIIHTEKCEVIVISMGAAGALLVTRDLAEKIPAPKVEVKSTVGAGDSMVAGITVALTNGFSLTDAVQYGVACGTATTMNAGTELCTREEADQLYAQIKQNAGQTS